MLSEDQVEDYQKNGYILVKGLFTPEEAAAMRAESHALLARLRDKQDATWASSAGLAGGKKTSLQHCHDAQFYSAAFSRLLTDPRFTDVAGQVLGTPNVQLHHTKLFVKPPSAGSPFPMHQDHPFFPHTYHRMGAAIMHFDASTVEKGCVRVVPGSYLNGPLEHLSEGSFHLDSEQWPIDMSVPCPAEPGDVLFFSYLTVHASGVNVSDEPRTTWLVQFRDPADPPLTDAHTFSLGQGMMLAGIDPTARGHADAAPTSAMGGGTMGGASVSMDGGTS